MCASGCILAIKLANIALTDHIKDGQRDGGDSGVCKQTTVFSVRNSPSPGLC